MAALISSASTSGGRARTSARYASTIGGSPRGSGTGYASSTAARQPAQPAVNLPCSGQCGQSIASVLHRRARRNIGQLTDLLKPP